MTKGRAKRIQLTRNGCHLEVLFPDDLSRISMTNVSGKVGSSHEPWMTLTCHLRYKVKVMAEESEASWQQTSGGVTVMLSRNGESSTEMKT